MLRGIGLRRFADLIGIHPSYLSRIETGQRGAGDQTLQRAAEVLQVRIESITDRETSRDQE